jgi:phage baseplate assembly protein V
LNEFDRYLGAARGDNARRANAVFRVGIVVAQDVETARVRVVFPDRDQMVSWWLWVVFPKTQLDKAYWLPDINEQVLCIMDENDEDGAVLGAIYSIPDRIPIEPGTVNKWHIRWYDGTITDYDRSTHTFYFWIPDFLHGEITIHTNQATVQLARNGDINITALQGNVNIMAMENNINLAAPNGDINFITDEHMDSVNGIIDTYNLHTHIDPGEGDTGIPNNLMNGGGGGWLPGTVYMAGRLLIDANFNTQTVITPGTSGPNPPDWQNTLNATTNDGTVVWKTIGLGPVQPI